MSIKTFGTLFKFKRTALVWRDPGAFGAFCFEPGALAFTTSEVETLNGTMICVLTHAGIVYCFGACLESL